MVTPLHWRRAEQEDLPCVLDTATRAPLGRLRQCGQCGTYVSSRGFCHHRPGATASPTSPPAPVSTTWRPLSVPNPGVLIPLLLSLGCDSTMDCWAFGNAGLAQHFTGGAWRPSSPLGKSALIGAVACPAPGNCWAVGTSGSGGSPQALVEHYSAENWNPVNTPYVSGTTQGVGTRMGSLPYRGHRPPHSSRRNEHGLQLPRLCDAAAGDRPRPAERRSLGVGGSGPRRASRPVTAARDDSSRLHRSSCRTGRSRRGLHRMGAR